MKTFGELSVEEQNELFQFELNGGEIECNRSCIEEWCTKRAPSWHKAAIYRKALTKPSIDWSHVHSDYNWIASDSGGDTYVYSEEPLVDICGTCWVHPAMIIIYADVFSSYKPGTCDWKDSLVKRPESE